MPWNSKFENLQTSISNFKKIINLSSICDFFWQSIKLAEDLNIIFVILTCFHLTNLVGEEKFSWMIKICIFRGTQIFSSNRNFQFFSSATLFLEGSALSSSSLLKQSAVMAYQFQTQSHIFFHISLCFVIVVATKSSKCEYFFDDWVWNWTSR